MNESQRRFYEKVRVRRERNQRLQRLGLPDEGEIISLARYSQREVRSLFTLSQGLGPDFSPPSMETMSDPGV